MASPAVRREDPFHTLVKYGLTTEEKQLQFQATQYTELVRKFEDITKALEFKGRHITTQLAYN